METRSFIDGDGKDKSNSNITGTIDYFPRHDLVATFRTENLTAQSTVMLPTECGKLLRTFVAFFGLRIGHPKLLQFGILVAR